MVTGSPIQGLDNFDHRCTPVELLLYVEHACSGLLKRIFGAYIQHASYGWRSIVQLPTIRRWFDEFLGVLEAREHEERRCDVGGQPSQCRPFEAIAVCGLLGGPDPSSLHHVIRAKPLAGAGVADELRHNQEARQVNHAPRGRMRVDVSIGMFLRIVISLIRYLP